MAKIKRGPKGTVAVRNYIKKFDNERLVSVAELEQNLIFTTEEILNVLDYLVEEETLTEVWGLSNFNGTPIYRTQDEIMLYVNLTTADGNDYWVTPECIIPLYKRN